MSTDVPEPLEDDFADLLAAYDGMLANGCRPPRLRACGRHRSCKAASTKR